MIEGALNSNIEKHKKWNETLSRVEKITDGKGMPVDSGIKEAVVAFLVNGFDTTSSCEGHTDRARPYPWVDIASEPQSLKFKQEIESALSEMKEKGYEDFFDVPQTDEELRARLMKLSNEAELYKNKVENNIESLLKDFYSVHKPMSKDFMLSLLESGRIEPVSGAGLGLDNWAKFESRIKAMSVEEKNNYLKNCQEEMNAFTEFLKNRFMKG